MKPIGHALRHILYNPRFSLIFRFASPQSSGATKLSLEAVGECARNGRLVRVVSRNDSQHAAESGHESALSLISMSRHCAHCKIYVLTMSTRPQPGVKWVYASVVKMPRTSLSCQFCQPLPILNTLIALSSPRAPARRSSSSLEGPTTLREGL